MATTSILSWNVAGIRACIKKGGLDFLLVEDHGIVCFQETKAEEDQVILPNEIKMKQIDLLYSLRQSLNKQQEVLSEEIKGLNVTIKEYKMSSMNNQSQLALVLEEIDLISPLIKFIDGEPIKDATNLVLGCV